MKHLLRLVFVVVFFGFLTQEASAFLVGPSSNVGGIFEIELHDVPIGPQSQGWQLQRKYETEPWVEIGYIPNETFGKVVTQTVTRNGKYVYAVRAVSKQAYDEGECERGKAPERCGPDAERWSTTEVNVYIPTQPETPSNIWFEGVYNSISRQGKSISISWSPDKKRNLNYTIQWQVESGDWQTQIENHSQLTLNFTLAEFGEYRFRVRACDQDLCSDYRTSSPIYVHADIAKDLPNPESFSQPTHNAAVGGVAGEHSVEQDGSASYVIPLDLSGSRHGLKPNLSLSYSSRAGNGVMGTGWTMRGLSAIQRCPTNELLGEFADPVDFDYSDRYCLDGQRLIYVKRESSVRIYYKEDDDGTRIEAYGESANPSYFKIITPDSLISYYGNSPDSNIKATGISVTATWALNRVEDRYSNFYTISYTLPYRSGSYRPKRINYTGNTNAGQAPIHSVRFIYNEGREDHITSYLGGSYSKLNWSLKRVEVFSFNNRLREYRLTYRTPETPPLTPYLDTVQMCADSACMPATKIHWSQERVGYSNSKIWINRVENGVKAWADDARDEQLIDLNGDGLVDRFWRPKDRSDYYAAINNNGDFLPPVKWMDASYRVNGATVGSPATNLQWYVDVNGDGLPDRIWDPLGSNNNMYLSFNLGKGFLPPRLLFNSTVTATNGIKISTRANDGRNYFVDFNNDGLVDRVWNPEKRGDFYVALNTGNNKFDTPFRVLSETIFDRSSNKHVDTQSYKNWHEYLADVNGDGYPDRFWVPLDLKDIRVAINIRGTGFMEATRWLEDEDYSFRIISHDGKRQRLMDVNGDSLPDWVWDPAGVDNGYWVALNTGVSLATPEQWSGHTENGIMTRSSDGKYEQYADFNGDGLPDRFWNPEGSNDNYYVAYNTGHSFSDPIRWLYATANGVKTLSYNGTREALVDLNGDGIPDRIWNPNGSDNDNIYVAVSRPNNRRVEKIIVGNGDNQSGHTTSFYYKPGTDSSVYTQKKNTNIFPLNYNPSSRALVSRVTTSNGVGGVFETQYFYKNATVHLAGYGDLGFGEMTVRNNINNIETVTTFNNFSHSVTQKIQGTVYQIRTQHVDRPDSSPLSLTTNFWRSIETGSKRKRLQLGATHVSKWSLAGTFLHTERNRYTYESITGAPLTVRTELREGDTVLREKVVTNTYQNFSQASGFIPPAIEKTQVDVTVTGKDTITTISAWEYDSLTGKKIKEQILHPETEEILKETEFHNIDEFGNHLSMTVRGADFAERSSSFTYDDSGRFITSSTNALGQTATAEYYGRNHQNDGLISEETDINGIRKKYYYDGFGRLTRTIDAYGTNRPINSFTSYQWCSDINDDSPCEQVSGSIASYRITTSTLGGSGQHVYIDKLGREVKRRAQNVDGRYINVVNHYNEKGRNHKVCDPFFDGDTPVVTEVKHDKLGRVIESVDANGTVNRVEYNGLERISTNDVFGKHQTKNVTTDIMGNIIHVVDSDRNIVRYKYDSLGNMTEVIDPENNRTIINYNALSQKVSMSDPNKGEWQYTYNALGELITQTNAKWDTSCTTYDLLGRKTRHYDIYQSDVSRELGGVADAKNQCAGASGEYSFWKYDSANGKSLGKLHQTGLSDGKYLKTHFYDASFGLETGVEERIDNAIYRTDMQYDNLHRVDTITYPGSSNRLALKSVYNNLGFQTQLINAANEDEVFYSLINTDAQGNVVEDYIGSGVRTLREYDLITNRIKSIQSWLLLDFVAPSIQELDFEFDVVGNLTARNDRIQNISETFEYDDLNRLIQTDVDFGNQHTEQTHVRYDALGNITFMTGVGEYSYGGMCEGIRAGPHAVSSITSPKSTSYCYDHNGNMVSGGGRYINYTPFDKPSMIRQGANVTEISYGPARARYKRVDTSNGKKTTYHYVGGAFEKVTLPNGDVEERTYVAGVAIRTVTTKASESPSIKIRYMHKDHLGSVTVITDEIGNIVEEFSFDAWGKRRPPNLETLLESPVFTELSSTITNKGFTGHEQMDGVGLIHMNGRVYDADIGRFISADPFVQDHTNLQALNRYSYVQNNPLSYTDPSGYFLKKIFKKFKKSIKRLVKAVKNVFKAIGRVLNAVPGMSTIVGIVISFYCPPCGAAYFKYLTLLNAAISLANGAPVGAVITNMAVAQVTAGVGAGIGNAIGSNAAGQMIASGIASKASGGKFIDGVKSAAIGMATNAAATYAGNKLVAGLSQLGEAKADLGAPDNSTGGASQTSSGSSCSANPINIATGEKYLIFKDYQAKGASELKFERYYSSYNHRKGSLGVAWKHNFERKLILHSVLDSTAFKVGVERENSETIDFVLSEGKDELVYRAVASDRFEQLTKTEDGYILTLMDDTKESYDNQGRLREVRSLSGYTQTLIYGEDDLLERVEDSFGQYIDFTYSDEGLLEHVKFTDDSWVAFSYSSPTHLERVTASDATPQILSDNPFKQYHYDNALFTHAITGITNHANERIHSMAYDDRGRATLSALADNIERVDMAFSDSEGETKTTTVTNVFGKQTHYTFDSQNKPIVIEGEATLSCFAASQNYEYNDQGLVTRKTDWNDTVTQFEYNERGLETLRIEAVGTEVERRVETEWHEQFRLPVKVVKAGNTHFYNYNQQGQVVKLIVRDTQSERSALAKLFRQYDERTWHYEYNSQSLLAKVDGPRTDVNDIETYEYDALGNRIATVNALGHRTQVLAHNERGLPRIVQNANGVKTHITYNARGWVESQTIESDTGDLVTYFTYTGKSDYEGEGLIESVQLPNGEVINYTYNRARQLIGQSNQRGERIEYTLDLDGNRIKETVYSADGNIERSRHQVYDELSRLLASFGTHGNATRYTYDKAGNRIQVEDALNNKTTMAYDALNRLVQSSDSTGEMLTTYTAYDQIASFTDQRGLTTEYIYNGFGEKIAQVSPDTGTTHYTYDKASNLLAKKDARDEVVTYQYDAINRLTSVVYPNSQEENIRYVYDSYQEHTDISEEYGAAANDHQYQNTIGRVAELHDSTGITRYRYNAHGQVTEKAYTTDGIAYSQKYHYGQVGQLIAMTYPNGDVVDYNHNDHGQLTGIRYQDKNIAQDFRRKPFGPPSGFTYGNQSELNLTYDQYYRITDIRVAGNLADNSAANDVLYDVGIEYDSASNITAINDAVNMHASQRFIYDNSNRLVNARGAYGEIRYAYDNVGNRLSREKEHGQTFIKEAYTYAQDSNRLLSVARSGYRNDKSDHQTRELSYDASGNIVVDQRADQTKHLTYNARNRLEGVTLNNGNTAIYRYNGQGQRVSKTVNGQVTHFHYDINKQLLAETSLQEGHANTVKHYLYGMGQRLAIAEEGHIRYLINDHLGTPQRLMDENQNIVWQENATPFGEMALAANDSVQPLNFPGQYRDSETGYSYNYFRDYDPSLGRYIQSDPIGLNGGVNTFGYVSGNPLVKYDPFGLEEFYFGGMGDNKHQRVKKNLVSQRNGNSAHYFQHKQVKQAVKVISSYASSNPGMPITIIGHSWGAKAALKASTKLGALNVNVDTLVTLDGTSWFRPPRPSNVGSWIAVDAVPSNSNMSDLGTSFGRHWNNSVENEADIFVTVDRNHEDAAGMMSDLESSLGQCF